MVALWPFCDCSLFICSKKTKQTTRITSAFRQFPAPQCRAVIKGGGLSVSLAASLCLNYHRMHMGNSAAAAAHSDSAAPRLYQSLASTSSPRLYSRSPDPQTSARPCSLRRVPRCRQRTGAPPGLWREQHQGRRLGGEGWGGAAGRWELWLGAERRCNSPDSDSRRLFYCRLCVDPLQSLPDQSFAVVIEKRGGSHKSARLIPPKSSPLMFLFPSHILAGYQELIDH